MRKLNTAQKVILILGIVGVITGIYGKWNGWEHKSYFIPMYTGLTFMWIAFLDDKNNCERTFFKRIFGKKQ
ncbi:hypothetical protein [Flagellimonas meishanensis]|uniref:hypothetical protein n=1 Tax=Flagellimonas meishanensis TaxID=2873264 RepID=UPI001CA72C90|nr:hypothetical protein [[Muricauda] meishanensis]